MKFKTFKTPIAYNKLDRKNEIITIEAMEYAIKNSKLPVPVLRNFDYKALPIGSVTKLEIKYDRLIATIKIQNKDYWDNKFKDSCFRMGGVEVDKKDNFITKFTLMCVEFIDKCNDVYDKGDK